MPGPLGCVSTRSAHSATSSWPKARRRAAKGDRLFPPFAVAPEFLPRIEKGDKAFASSEFLPKKMRWLKDVNDDL
jgi:hypothetical protein